MAESESKKIEEFKLLADERRFLSTRYMHGMVLYLVFYGFAFKELLSTESRLIALSIIGFLSATNVLTLYGAIFFKRLASLATTRARLLANELGMQPLGSLQGGFWFGVVGVVLVEAALIVTGFVM